MRVKDMWQMMQATPCGMMKSYEHPEFETGGRQETLSLLPPLENAKILELACGIGRFTKELAERASKSHLVSNTRLL